MSAVYADTSVFLLAAGEPATGRDDAVAYLDGVGEGLEVHLSVEAVQEFLFHRMRRAGRAVALAQTEALTESVVLHPFDHGVLRRSLDLVRDTDIRGRDAVHAATALEIGLDTIVTFDRDLAVVPGLQVVRPQVPRSAHA